MTDDPAPGGLETIVKETTNTAEAMDTDAAGRTVENVVAPEDHVVADAVAPEPAAASPAEAQLAHVPSAAGRSAAAEGEPAPLLEPEAPAAALRPKIEALGLEPEPTAAAAIDPVKDVPTTEPVALPPPPPLPEPLPSPPHTREERKRDSSSRRDSKDKESRRDRKDSRRSRSRDRMSSRRRSKSRSKSRDRRSKRRSKSRSKSRERRRARRSKSRERPSSKRSRSRDRVGGRSSSKRSSRSPSRRSPSRRSPARRSPARRSHSHRRSRSSSNEDKLGGYNPRRRVDTSLPPPPAVVPAAMALPRPAVLPGAVSAGINGGPNLATVVAGHATNTDPFAHLRQASVPADPNAAARLWQEQQLHARQVVLQQQAAAAAAAATKTQREARRLYVGNLGGGRVSDMALRQLFNAALMPAFPGSQVPGMEPVVNLTMHSEGRYCFVELRSAEMATAAMQLNGQVQLPGLSGPLSVERPSGYVDPSRAQQAAAAAAQALTAFQAGDTAAMTAAATLSASLTGMPNAAAALPGLPAAMPGMLPGPPGLPGLPGFPAAAFPGLPGPPALPGMLPMPATPAPAALPPPVAPPQDALSPVPTEFLCVTGVVTASVLKDDNDYSDVKEELLDECGRHAPSGVVEVKVPRPADPQQVDALFGTGHFGRAFVRFADSSGASKARDAIHGRLFAGVTVQAVYITQAAYEGVTV